jgi:hypothetical protein
LLNAWVLAGAKAAAGAAKRARVTRETNFIFCDGYNQSKLFGEIMKRS